MEQATMEKKEAAPQVPTGQTIKSPILMPEKMGLAEFKEHHWVIDIDPKLSVQEITDPAFWSHVASQMDPLDRITARWEDGSKVVHLRVQFCERTYAKVKVVSIEDLGDSIKEAPASSMKHSIEWKGPAMKFAVIRNSDKEIVQSGFKERGLAAAWLVEHERS